MANKRTGSIQVFGNALLRLIDSRVRNNNADGVIVDVDETKFTATVKVGEVSFYDVPLRVLISSQASFVEIPAENTNCVVVFRDANMARPYILEVHECSKILYKIGSTTCEVKDGEWSFNGGNLGGLVKVNEILDKVNAIETDINTLKTKFSTWVPVASDGGAALKTITGSWFAKPLTKTKLSDIENTRIKQ